MAGAEKKTIFYVHWHRDELAERIRTLVAAGFTVLPHAEQGDTPEFRELPDVVVLSLDRLPSHSKAWAEWVYAAKKRQHIPVILVGGKPDKVAVAREQFPRAVFCATAALPGLLAACG